MSAGTRIAAFAALLVAVFAAASLAGAALDPKVDRADHDDESEMSEQGTDPHSDAPEAEHGGVGAATAALPGLAVAQDGYRLVADRTRLPSDPSARFGFRIVDDEGRTVSDFDTEHARRMHLIVIRRDFANFQHLHPRQREDGGWEVEVDLDPAGVYRVFADFATDGQSLTLAGDLFAAGPFEPQPLPAVANRADAGAGYEVSLESPAPRAEVAAPVRFSIARDGRRVDSVQPYLGADGHLVALREHDQAFLHTHPEGEPGGPGPISFEVTYPTPGRYRLYLQFKHRGAVHTAAFTQDVVAAEENPDGGH